MDWRSRERKKQAPKPGFKPKCGLWSLGWQFAIICPYCSVTSKSTTIYWGPRGQPLFWVIFQSSHLNDRTLRVSGTSLCIVSSKGKPTRTRHHSQPQTASLTCSSGLKGLTFQPLRASSNSCQPFLPGGCLWSCHPVPWPQPDKTKPRMCPQAWLLQHEQVQSRHPGVADLRQGWDTGGLWATAPSSAPGLGWAGVEPLTLLPTHHLLRCFLTTCLRLPLEALLSQSPSDRWARPPRLWLLPAALPAPGPLLAGCLSKRPCPELSSNRAEKVWHLFSSMTRDGCILPYRLEFWLSG